MRKWWFTRSETFSRMCGEKVTHGEVILTNIGIMALLAACGLAEWIGGLPW